MLEDKKKESLLEKVGNSPAWESIFRSGVLEPEDKECMLF